MAASGGSEEEETLYIRNSMEEEEEKEKEKEEGTGCHQSVFFYCLRNNPLPSGL